MYYLLGTFFFFKVFLVPIAASGSCMLNNWSRMIFCFLESRILLAVLEVNRVTPNVLGGACSAENQTWASAHETYALALWFCPKPECSNRKPAIFQVVIWEWGFFFLSGTFKSVLLLLCTVIVRPVVFIYPCEFVGFWGYLNWNWGWGGRIKPVKTIQSWDCSNNSTVGLVFALYVANLSSIPSTP